MFTLFLLITIVAMWVAVKKKSWIVKAVCLIPALGGANITLAALNVDSGGSVLLVNAAVFLVIGLSSIMIKDKAARTTGNVILGVFLVIVGAALLYFAIDVLETDSSDSFLTAIRNVFSKGFSVFFDSLKLAFEGK